MSPPPFCFRDFLRESIFDHFTMFGWRDLPTFKENFDNPLSTTLRVPEMTKVATARPQPSRLTSRIAHFAAPLPRPRFPIPVRYRQGAGNPLSPSLSRWERESG